MTHTVIKLSLQHAAKIARVFIDAKPSTDVGLGWSLEGKQRSLLGTRFWPASSLTETASLRNGSLFDHP
jgi:hypothetical protein